MRADLDDALVRDFPTPGDGWEPLLRPRYHLVIDLEAIRLGDNGISGAKVPGRRSRPATGIT